jgi:hypothetical protein
MKDSWRSFCRRLAATTVVSGSVAWSSAMCYATQLAFDSADDPVYADGWQGSRTNNMTGLPEGPVGDNGGFNSSPGDGVDFEPWNFDTDWWFETSDGIHGIDDGLKAGTDTGMNSSSTFNDIGKALRIAHPAMGDVGLPRAGRGFPTLQPGQTFRVVVDNPLAGNFFKGYFVRFNTRYGLPDHIGGNICYGGQSPHPGSCYEGDYKANGQINVSMFQYVDHGRPTDGQWFISDNAGTPTPLYDTDKIADPFPFGDPMPYFGTDRGMRIDLKIDDADANLFTLTMTPFNDDGSLDTAHAFVHNGEVDFLDDGIDWIEFTFFNGDITDPESATDFYIRSMEIFDSETPAGVPGDYNNDDKVNAADYTLWRNHLGQSFQLENEVAGVTPGMVTIEDYDAWKSRFGNMQLGGGAGSVATGGGVPEPGTCVFLIAAGISGIATFRRRKGSNRDDFVDHNPCFG